MANVQDDGDINISIAKPVHVQFTSSNHAPEAMDPRRGFEAYDNQLQLGVLERVPFSLGGVTSNLQQQQNQQEEDAALRGSVPPDTDRDVNQLVDLLNNQNLS